MSKKKKAGLVSSITGDRATIFSNHPLYPALAHIATLERTVVQLRAQNDCYMAHTDNMADDIRDLTKANASLTKQLAKLTKAKKK